MTQNRHGPLQPLTPEKLRAFSMLEDSAALIGIYDQNEVLQLSNAAFRQAYFIRTDEVINWTTLMRRNYEARRGTIIETDDIDAWIASVRSRRGKNTVRTYESDLHDGRWIWVVETMQADGWIIYVGTDVTCLNESERHLRHARDAAMRASQTDDLTGISNRRHIMSQLEALASQAAPEAEGLGYACLMDLDRFKSINDTMGHQTGDEVLRNFARCVRKEIRLRDGFGRVGGEEFLIIFPDLTLEETQRALRRLYRKVRAERLIVAHPDHQVTFSAGLTPILPEDTGSEVYTRCDGALYAAKAKGRDCYVVADG